MTAITFQDCEALYEKFVDYTKTAEQHEFPKLAMLNMMLDSTREKQWNIPQKERRAMFRTVLRAIGEDCSAYEEDENEE